MKTRDFDPVLSAALRDELEALAGRPSADATPAPHRRARLRRPQVWITVLTSVLLVAATLGVLRFGSPLVQSAAPGAQVVDPLTSVTTPTSPYYAARSVRTLLHARGTGTGTHVFTVPAGVTDVRLYLNCAPEGRFNTRIDGHLDSSGGCSRDSGNSTSGPIATGAHELAVRIRAGTAYRVLIIATPAPTVSTGALIDPLQQVRDLRVPDALTGDTTPLLRLSGTGSSAVQRFTVPSGGRLRVLLACRPSSAATAVRVDGRLVSGCMNSVAHWFDLTPRSRSVNAQVLSEGSGAWALLVVPAPAGAEDSPANTLLPYPTRDGTVLARARGAGAQQSGTYRRSGDTVTVVLTCRGTGWLEVDTGDGSTWTRGQACGKDPLTAGFGGASAKGRLLRWSVTPHGDISWTAQLLSTE